MRLPWWMFKEKTAGITWFDWHQINLKLGGWSNLGTLSILSFYNKIQNFRAFINKYRTKLITIKLLTEQNNMTLQRFKIFEKKYFLNHMGIFVTAENVSNIFLVKNKYYLHMYIYWNENVIIRRNLRIIKRNHTYISYVFSKFPFG